MDIYEQAKNMNADYYDPATGYIYKIMDYNHAINNGLPTDGIHVFNARGKWMGVAGRKYGYSC